MRIEMVFESKFNEGDLVSVDGSKDERRILQIKISSSFKFLYLLTHPKDESRSSGVWLSEDCLSLVYTADQQLQMIHEQEQMERYDAYGYESEF